MTANVVAPGFIETDMTAVLSEEVIAVYLASIPRTGWASRRRWPQRSPSPHQKKPVSSAVPSSLLMAALAWVTERLDMGILEGKNILVAGVTMNTSIGYRVVELAQAEGANVVVSNFGRAMSLTERVLKRLDTVPPLLELDVVEPEHPRHPRRPTG